MTDASSAVADAVRYFDSWLAFRQQRDRIPGVQAAVLEGEEIALSTAHGRAHLASGQGLTRRHLFRIASHSKTFTATAVLQLVQRGALRLDDPVGQWLRFLPDAGSPAAAVTIRELLSHGGGLVRDGADADFWQLFRPFPTPKQLQRVALDDGNVIGRNERFKYSNIGYGLLGLVIEAASGEAFSDYVRANILDVLGLADTGPDYDPARADEYASGYTSLAYGDDRLPIEHVGTGALAPATGFYSTAEDVVRYVAAHFSGDERLLDADSQRLLHRTEWPVDGTDDSYALGFAVVQLGKRRLLGHGGGYPGHISHTLFDPVGRLAVCVLTNAIDGPAQALTSAAFKLVDLAGAGNGTMEDRARLARFRGRFANLWGVFDVVDLGGRLYQMAPGRDDPSDQPTELEVLDDRTLGITKAAGYGSYGETIRYDLRDDGSVRSVRGGGSTSYPLEQLRADAAGRAAITLGSPLGSGAT